MKVSFAITCCNEYEELGRLLDQLVNYVKPEDEIVIQQDNYDPIDSAAIKVHTLCLEFKDAHKGLNVEYINYPLNRDFANFKNNLKKFCNKDYIFFLDADETVSDNLLEHLHLVLESNQVDLIMVPRANTVAGLTEEHVRKWGWRIGPMGLINWPDFQGRLVKNREDLKWNGKVHERVEGFKTLSHLPIDNLDWCLVHRKDIKKQEYQNKLYESI